MATMEHVGSQKLLSGVVGRPLDAMEVLARLKKEAKGLLSFTVSNDVILLSGVEAGRRPSLAFAVRWWLKLLRPAPSAATQRRPRALRQY